MNQILLRCSSIFAEVANFGRNFLNICCNEKFITKLVSESFWGRPEVNANVAAYRVAGPRGLSLGRPLGGRGPAASAGRCDGGALAPLAAWPVDIGLAEVAQRVLSTCFNIRPQ